MNGIPIEAFLYEGRPIREGLVELLKKSWKEKSIGGMKK